MTPGNVRVIPLASGSRGNALLVDSPAARLLVDAGIPARRLERALAGHGVVAASLTGVLVTHEHSDHVGGLAVFARRHRLPVWSTAGTRTAVVGAAALDWRDLRVGQPTNIGSAQVTAVPVSHDAREPVGYLIEVGKVAVAVFTDLGCAEHHLVAPIQRADLVVLEANHDLDRLWKGPYPWVVKQRVASATGHLCNEDCGALLASALPDDRPRVVWLAHLSAENNEPELARAAVAERLAGRPVGLAVLAPDGGGLCWQG